MSNDLVFSITPRNTKVPVKPTTSVTRVKKDANSEKINDKDRESQQQKHLAEHEAQEQNQGKSKLDIFV